MPDLFDIHKKLKAYEMREMSEEDADKRNKLMEEWISKNRKRGWNKTVTGKNIYWQRMNLYDRNLSEHGYLICSLCGHIRKNVYVEADSRGGSLRICEDCGHILLPCRVCKKKFKKEDVRVGKEGVYCQPCLVV